MGSVDALAGFLSAVVADTPRVEFVYISELDGERGRRAAPSVPGWRTWRHYPGDGSCAMAWAARASAFHRVVGVCSTGRAMSRQLSGVMSGARPLQVIGWRGRSRRRPFVRSAAERLERRPRGRHEHALAAARARPPGRRRRRLAPKGLCKRRARRQGRCAGPPPRNRRFSGAGIGVAARSGASAGRWPRRPKAAGVLQGPLYAPSTGRFRAHGGAVRHRRCMGPDARGGD